MSFLLIKIIILIKNKTIESYGFKTFKDTKGRERAKLKFIPAWSLATLLGLIPYWTMDKTDKVNLTCNLYYHCESCYEDIVDAVFEMVCWLKENNLL